MGEGLKMANRKVTNTLFDCVKLMLDSKASYDEISSYMGVSLATIGRIKHAANYEEYKNLTGTAMYLATQKNKKQKEEKPEPITQAQAPSPMVEDLKLPGGTMSASYQLNRIYELQKKQVETLILISNKLAFIVDELTGTPAKKGGD